MVITIIFGLLSRSEFVVLPDFLITYLGDTLWALMVFWIACVIFPNKDFKLLATISLLFSFGIEFTQLYHAPWLDDIRNTTLGGLVLGFGFKLSDLICYTVGIAFGVIADAFLSGRLNITPTD